MFISKGSYGYGEPKNVLLYFMEKPHLPVRVCKLPRFMGGSVGPRMEICETSGLPIPMLPHFYQSNGYIKRKLRVWRAQKRITLVDAETVFTSVGPQTTTFHGGQYRVVNRNILNFRPTNPHATAFPPKQWLYRKEATGRKSSKMYCPTRCRNSTYQCGVAHYPFYYGGQYRVGNGNMRNFRPTNFHGTAFAPKQCLYHKEATGMEIPKMYCSSLWKNPTYLYGTANYPVSWVAV